MVACTGLFTACSNEVDEVIDNGSDTKADAYLSVSFTMPAGATTRAASDNPNGGEKGDGNEEGTTAENAVTDVDMYLFNIAEDGTIGTLGLKRHIEHGEITGSQNGNVYTTNPVQVLVGKYAVYIVVNQPETDIDNINSIAIGASLADFQAKCYSAAAKTGAYCTGNHFLMTNAFEIGAEKGTGNSSYKEGIADITKENNDASKAATVTVSVERAAARIDFTVKNADNAYEVKNANGIKIADVTIKSYKILNTRSNAWFLKRVSKAGDTADLIIGGDEKPDAGTNTNYVVENKFNIKQTTKDFFSTVDYTNNYSRRYNTYVSWKKITTTTVKDKQVLAYCMENTMPQANQVLGLTTTVLFKAKYTPVADAITGTLDADGTFYRFKEGTTLYATIADVLKAKYNVADGGDVYDAAIKGEFLNLSEEAFEAAQKADDTLTKESYVTVAINTAKQAGLYAENIEKFVNGICYYSFMIRHSNNNDPNVSGIMEFATVRNNIYKLAINSVSSLGDFTSGTPGPKDPNKPEEGRPDEPDNTDGGNPEIPGVTDTENPEDPTPIVPVDPSNPDENLKTYLDATINILDWTLRNNGIDL